MKGKYSFIIQDKYVRYEFEIRRNVTVLYGDSGTGKSTLVEMVMELHSHKAKGTLKCNMAELVVGCNGMDEVADYILISTSKGKIIFIDGECGYVRSKWFSDEVGKGENYFFIITRNDMDMIAYSVREMYQIKSERHGKQMVNTLERRYVESDSDGSAIPDVVVCEDRCSGYEAMGRIFCCDVQSAEGNSSVCSVARGLNKQGKGIYCIVDGAAYGAFVGEMMRLVRGKAGSGAYVGIMMWESFEWAVLDVIRHSRDIGETFSMMLDEPWEYCDSRKFKSWERYFTYLLGLVCDKGVLGIPFKYSKKKLDSALKVGWLIGGVSGMLRDVDGSAKRC